MAQYEVEAPKDRNVAVRAGGRHYVLLKGTKQTYEASGDVIGILEAHGCTAKHVGDEATVEAAFHAAKVAEAQDAGNQRVGVQAKVTPPAGDEEEGDPTDLSKLKVPELKALAEERSILLPAGAKKDEILALLEADAPEGGEEE